jgi:O-antigen/teichoic acid export membrane protein
MLFMARYLSPEEIGIYGLVITTIIISIYFLGLDFYVVNTREILAQSNKEEKARLVRDQLAFHGVVYIFVLPMLLVVFMAGLLPWKYIIWFYVLLVLEHLSQEATRLFFTLSLPIVANIVLFFRSGAWVYAVIGVFLFSEETKQLTTVWMGWTIGILISLGLSVYYLTKALDFTNVNAHKVDWKWIKIGVKGALIFLTASIALKLIEYMDRYFIQYYLGEAMVGVYTFYMSIAKVVETFVFTGLISILYPRIVTSYQQGNIEEYRSLMKKMSIGSIASAIMLALMAAIGMVILLKIIDKPIYAEYLETYWLLLVAIVLIIVGYIPHYALYVRHADKMILIATLLGLLVTVVGNMVLIPMLGLLGAGVSAVLAVGTMLIAKSYFLKFKHYNDDVINNYS